MYICFKSTLDISECMIYTINEYTNNNTNEHINEFGFTLGVLQGRHNNY